MIFLYGTRRTNRKRIAARNDFCNACEREAVAEQWQSDDYGHLFFIPFLPLGTRKIWQCSNCGQDPRARYKSKGWLKIIGLLVLPFPALILLLAPDSPGSHAHPSDAYAPYGMLLIFGGAWLGVLYSLLKRDTGPTEDQRRQSIRPLRINQCLYCRTPLVFGRDPHCPGCGVHFEAVPTVKAAAMPPPLPPSSPPPLPPPPSF